jgi:hypothetical protein
VDPQAFGAFLGAHGRVTQISILCNPLLPADLRAVWFQKSEPPLPARILTTRTCQTGHNPSRWLRKPATKRAG